MRTILNGWETERGQLHYVTAITARPCNNCTATSSAGRMHGLECLTVAEKQVWMFRAL